MERDVLYAGEGIIKAGTRDKGQGTRDKGQVVCVLGRGFGNLLWTVDQFTDLPAEAAEKAG